MEEMKCTYDVFAFSPRALLLRKILLLLAHPATLLLHIFSLVVSIFWMHSAEAVGFSFLMGFGLILIRFFRRTLFRWLDALARRDAKALRLRCPQHYAQIRHELFPEPLTGRTAQCTCSIAYFRPL